MYQIKLISQNLIRLHKKKKSIFANRYLQLSLLLFCVFRYAESSQADIPQKDMAHAKYRLDQARVEKLASEIPGLSSCDIDIATTKVILNNRTQELAMIISGIQQNKLRDSGKMIILHGLSGTGKSSIAKAIAMHCQVPCLFFKAGGISTEYMNSGVQNLKKIFECANSLNGPCIVIFDELEALTKKHVNKDNHENNLLMHFWQELDSKKGNHVIVIGTMNSTQDLPAQMTSRSKMIKIPLPEYKERKAVISHYLDVIKKRDNVVYANFISGTYLAQRTKGFSHRDLQKVVEEATEPAMLDTKKNPVTNINFAHVIKRIKQDPARKLEREIGTWKHSFKTSVKDPRIIIPIMGMTVVMYGISANLASQKESREQSQRIAAEQQRLQRSMFNYNLSWWEQGV